MWNYQKRLQYPVKIKNADPAMARIVLAQLGGPDGEMGAATRYLNQRYAMPYDEGKAILTDIGTEVPVLLKNGRGSGRWNVLVATLKTEKNIFMKLIEMISIKTKVTKHGFPGIPKIEKTA